MTLKTVIQGDSFSIGFQLNPEYDVSRIKNVYAFLGNKNLNATIENGMVRGELSSEETKFMCGVQHLSFQLDDISFGMRKSNCGDILFVTNKGISTQSVNLGYNLIIEVNINEEVTTTNLVLIEAIKGLSAYKVWLLENAGKTTQDYFNFLQEPATLAAGVVDEAFLAWTTNESDRIFEENSRINSENTRIESESLRVNAENLRKTLSEILIEAEGFRNESEVDRTASEFLRVTAEGLRVDIEILRVNAEQGRTTEEGMRVIAESARVAAEGLRVTAASNHVAAENLRMTAEELRVTTENLRKTAETARATAEGLRVTVDAGRTTALNNKVDKVAGKSLVSDAEITRLALVTNQTLAGLGIGNVNNTSDLSKPVSTAQKAEFDLRPKAVNGIYPVSVLPGVEDFYAYGVQYDLASSSPILMRVGNSAYHASLPIQTKMKGCLLLDNGTVNYYLHPTNWALKEDGITASKLDGTDGQVMIEIPKFYRKFEYPTATTYRCMISEYPIVGFTEIKKQYISAYEATIQRSNLKLSSVANLTADFRGSNNDATKDLLANTQLGKPATVKTITDFRTYARNRNASATSEWNQLSYETYKSVCWLYYIEFANLNCQLPVLGKDSNGYATGGLGNGVTTADYTKWVNYNGAFPIVNCGAANSLGNNTGEVAVSVTDFGGAGIPQIFTVPRYRGIENLFGHIWKFTDGIMVDVKTDADGGTSTVLTTLLPANYASVLTANYVVKGLESRAEGWAKTMLLGITGELITSSVGGGSSTYWCDYKYCNVASSSLRCVLFGGGAVDTTYAGLGCSYTHYSFSAASANFGSRLCFIPQG